MKVDILTLFPKMFESVLSESILKRAQDKDILKVVVHDLRKWTFDNHRSADDKPFGGGAGMVMKIEPIYLALKDLGAIKGKGVKVSAKSKPYVILLTPQGNRFCQNDARRISKKKRIVLICGHYEGVDERVLNFVDEEISIGDYVLTGGEIPAAALIDASVRLIPGVLGSEDSLVSESFENDMLEYPHYTRPAEFLGMKVPQVLLSGDHKKIEAWRNKEAMCKTRKIRPDLIKNKKG